MGKGGGNDGGVIAAKRYLIKTATVDRSALDREKVVQQVRARSCALSGERLKAPVVADELGNLFNKEAVLSFLLEKRTVPAFSHIKSMKQDVFPVTLTPAAGAATASSADTSDAAVFRCPLSMVEATAAHAFVALRPCGCVMAEEALRELNGGSGSGSSVRKDSGSSSAAGSVSTGASTSACPVCSAPYSPVDDIIKLFADDAETEAQRERMLARRAERKGKKGKAPAGALATAATAAADWGSDGSGGSSGGPSHASAAVVPPVGTERGDATGAHSSASSSSVSATTASAAGASVSGVKRPREEAGSNSASATAPAAALVVGPGAAASAAARPAGSAAAACGKAPPAKVARTDGRPDAGGAHRLPLPVGTSSSSSSSAAPAGGSRGGTGTSGGRGAPGGGVAAGAAPSASADVAAAVAQQKAKSAVFASLFTDNSKTNGARRW